MTNLRIVYTDATGHCCVTEPAEEFRKRWTNVILPAEKLRGVVKVEATEDNEESERPEDDNEFYARVEPVIELVSENDTDFLNRVIASLRKPDHPHQIPDGVKPAVVLAASVPADPHYRAARTFTDGRFGWDMSKARELHKDRLRVARKAPLEALDVAVTGALAKGDADGAKAAEAARQALRDVTALESIAQAKTPDELRAVWPFKG